MHPTINRPNANAGAHTHQDRRWCQQPPESHASHEPPTDFDVRTRKVDANIDSDGSANSKRLLHQRTSFLPTSRTHSDRAATSARSSSIIGSATHGNIRLPSTPNVTASTSVNNQFTFHKFKRYLQSNQLQRCAIIVSTRSTRRKHTNFTGHE